MKKIYLIRHAKAQKTDKIDDFDRELSPRGKDDVKIMAGVLDELGVMPDAVYSSGAKRCIQTAKRFCDLLKFKGKIEIVDSLYLANANEIVDFISSLDDTLSNIFVIAHNPAITEACEIISHSLIDSMPTCAICCIEFEDSFLNMQETRLTFYDFPKNHKNS